MQPAQFQLDNQRSKINGVNVRSELHGSEHVPACDISISTKLSNDALAFFDAALKGALYSRDTDKSKQGDLVGGISDAPVFRFPLLCMPLQWDWVGAGYTLTVHYGVGGIDIVLDVDVDKIKIDCMEGGTVEVSFRCQAHPTEAKLGRLCTLIQCEVNITLDPPTAEQAQESLTPENTEKKQKRGRGKAREEAESAFE